MLKPISVQLYSVRELAKDDFHAVLKRIADIGYAAVEPAGFWNDSPDEFKKYVEDLGMKILSSHRPWTTPDNINEVVDLAGILGIKTAACGFGADDFANRDAIKRTADKINTMADALAPHGITLFCHNHFWEFGRINSQFKYNILLEMCPRLMLELDVYWAANFGAEDPVKMVRDLADRIILLHIKDGDYNPYRLQLPVGSGLVDIPGVIAAAPDATQALVVELDYFNGDMMIAIEKSYDYLVGNKLARGTREVQLP